MVFTKGQAEVARIQQRPESPESELEQTDERCLSGIRAAWGGQRDPRDALTGLWKGRRPSRLAE
eukprot:8574521-Heterocapsa_arctica.AAC.1